jgi:hypothetical protein
MKQKRFTKEFEEEVVRLLRTSGRPRQLSAITSTASTTPYGDIRHWTLSARPHSRGWPPDQNLLSAFLRQVHNRC